MTEQLETVRDIESLSKFETKNVIVKNNVATCFVSALAGKPMYFLNDFITEKEEYRLAKVVESLMALTSRDSILPVHFREQLLFFMQSHSKMIVDILGQSAPASSYTT